MEVNILLLVLCSILFIGAVVTGIQLVKYCSLYHDLKKRAQIQNNYECLSCGAELNEFEILGPCCPSCQCSVGTGRNFWQFKVSKHAK